MDIDNAHLHALIVPGGGNGKEGSVVKRGDAADIAHIDIAVYVVHDLLAGAVGNLHAVYSGLTHAVEIVFSGASDVVIDVALGRDVVIVAHLGIIIVESLPDLLAGAFKLVILIASGDDGAVAQGNNGAEVIIRRNHAGNLALGAQNIAGHIAEGEKLAVLRLDEVIYVEVIRLGRNGARINGGKRRAIGAELCDYRAVFVLLIVVPLLGVGLNALGSGVAARIIALYDPDIAVAGIGDGLNIARSVVPAFFLGFVCLEALELRNVAAVGVHIP